MPFVIFLARSRERSQLSLLGRMLSRLWLVITIEAEPRIAKQYKCHHCCSCKNHMEKVMEDGKKNVFALFFG